MAMNLSRENVSLENKPIRLNFGLRPDADNDLFTLLLKIEAQLRREARDELRKTRALRKCTGETDNVRQCEGDGRIIDVDRP